MLFCFYTKALSKTYKKKLKQSGVHSMNRNFFIFAAMVTIGPKTIHIVNQAMNYVIETLNDQLAIPNYDSSWASGHHELIKGLTSELIFKITIKNATVTNDTRDLGLAMADVAEILVEDYLEADCDIDNTFNDLKTRRYFKVDHTYSVSRTSEINGNAFEITVDMTRTYTKKSNEEEQ